MNDIYLSIYLSEDGSHHPHHLHPQQLTQLPHSRGNLRLLHSETEKHPLVLGLVRAARPTFDTVSIITKHSAWTSLARLLLDPQCTPTTAALPRVQMLGEPDSRHPGLH